MLVTLVLERWKQVHPWGQWKNQPNLTGEDNLTEARTVKDPVSKSNVDRSWGTRPKVVFWSTGVDILIHAHMVQEKPGVIN